MGTSNSQDIRRTYGIDVTMKKLDIKAEQTVARQMAAFTTPRRIVKGMHFFSENVKVQRAGAKQLSNLAFNVENVSTVLSNNGLNRLMKAIRTHMNDWKLCWFGASAIWNMARPAEARLDVGASIDLLVQMLRLHQTREQVAHTVLGALSNLALEERNANKMINGGVEFYELIFDTLTKHHTSRSVMTSALGLLANLAIRENIASELAEFGAVKWVVKGLALFMERISHPDNETQMMLIENGMAALSNITFVETFPRHFLRAFGLEVLCDLMRTDADVPLSDEEDLPLLRNILESVGITVAQAEDKECDVYSLHQTIKMNFEDDKDTVPTMLAMKGIENLINVTDGADMTPLRYAVFNANKQTAELLITSGAKVRSQDLEGCEEGFRDYLIKCEKTYQSMLYTTKHAVTSSTDLNSDLAGVVINFLSKFELRNTFGGAAQWG